MAKKNKVKASPSQAAAVPLSSNTTSAPPPTSTPVSLAALRPPQTVHEQTAFRHDLTNPVARLVAHVGGSVQNLPTSEGRDAFYQSFAIRNAVRHGRGTSVFASSAPEAAGVVSGSSSNANANIKAEREFWKEASAKHRLPTRPLAESRHNWGRDTSGKDLGDYTIAEFEERTSKRGILACLELGASRTKREITRLRGTIECERAKEASTAASEGLVNSGSLEDLGSQLEKTLGTERLRRPEVSALKQELYGEKMSSPYAQDPVWDDIEPIPLQESDNALASIAYPENYAEAVSYLRAVMAKDEYSHRCLALTEDVIDKNPAHYTVWLYRIKIVTRLDLPYQDEFQWLNKVALKNLKNYQIWHHRQVLLEYALSKTTDPAERDHLAKSESQFLSEILNQDAKNYHVWSYRQHLVREFSMWPSTPLGEAELASTTRLIDEDVQNNSAWSHRFFVVFSDPTTSSQDRKKRSPLVRDETVPQDTITREIEFTKVKIRLAPQNQSGWNYLRGVATKGWPDITPLLDFTGEFVKGLGGEDEVVQSSHALDLMADIYELKNDASQACRCWDRLKDKWDPIRAGYWQYRRNAVAAT